MTRNFLNSIGRAAGLTALLLALPLAGWAAPAQTQLARSATGTRTPRPDPGSVWLQILAFTEAPVVGADVRVSAHGQLLVEARAATNKYGAFSAAVPRHLRSFRVTISGGTTNDNPFPAHLVADVVLTAPAHEIPGHRTPAITDLANQFEIVVVNPVTTLVSVVLDRRRDFNIPDREPKLELDDAQVLVRRFLKLPPNYDLGMALRQSSHYKSRFFSPVALVTQAEAAGGLDALVHLLLQELASGSTHSFRQPQLLGSTSSSDPSSILQAGLAAAALDIASAAGVENLAGWALALGGFSTSASSDDIDALVMELQDLDSAISNLSSQIAALSKQVVSSATYTQFTNESTAATVPWANNIQALESKISSYATNCSPLASGTTPPPNPDPSCASLYSDLAGANGELQQEYDNNWYEQVQSQIQDNPAAQTKGIIHLYSLFLGQSKPFFRAADSTTMQNLYDYWDSILTAGANARMEYFHVQNYQNSPAGINTITGFMAPSGQTPVCVGTATQSIIGAFQCNETANSSLMFPPVPAGTVVNTSDHLMWSLVPWVTANEDYGIPDQYVPAPQCWSWNTPFFQGAPYYPLLPYAGFNDWTQSPNKSQWQALVQNAPSGSNTPNWMTWLIQQTQTTGNEMPTSPGFFNWTTCSGNAYTYAWTSTGNGGLSYWYINPINRSFGTIATNQFPHYYQQNGTGGIVNVPARTLAAKEQYYWYQ